MQNLQNLYQKINDKRASYKTANYRIPSQWHPNHFAATKPHDLNLSPIDWHLASLDYILAHPSSSISFEKETHGNWIQQSVIYGCFLRSFTAYDHDGDGILGGDDKDITLNGDSMRETGTLLKAISLLPYIHQLGANAIYLLPISVLSKFSIKGELGSPYAIKNILSIEKSLADPLLNDLSADDLFKLFVDAAHHLGIRVILDFVLRTTAKDAVWVEEHPEWYYWIKKEGADSFMPPAFSEKELKEIYEQYHDPKKHRYIAPSEAYRSCFTLAPSKINHYDEHYGFIGNSQGHDVVVPGAFADWPPDDLQPLWSDITYLKLHTDPAFNYVAYNTVRAYDERINGNNQSLWNQIAEVIPYFQKTFGIDGARIDMGHALPKELEKRMIEETRTVNPEFSLIEENFDMKSQSTKRGYNLIWGPSFFMQPNYFKKDEVSGAVNPFIHFTKELSTNHGYILGTPETFDSPRSVYRAGKHFSKLSFLINCLLPKVVPFINAGFELGDSTPTNLGLGYSSEEIEKLMGQPLALFDRASLSWSEHSDIELMDFIRVMLRFRKDHLSLINNSSAKSLFIVTEDKTGTYYSFARANQEMILIAIANFSREKALNYLFNPGQNLNQIGSFHPDLKKKLAEPRSPRMTEIEFNKEGYQEEEISYKPTGELDLKIIPHGFKLYKVLL